MWRTKHDDEVLRWSPHPVCCVLFPHGTVYSAVLRCLNVDFPVLTSLGEDKLFSRVNEALVGTFA